MEVEFMRIGGDDDIDMEVSITTDNKTTFLDTYKELFDALVGKRIIKAEFSCYNSRVKLLVED
jgi:hypothetical protein